MVADECAKDAEGALLLQDRHKDHQSEIAQRLPSFDALAAVGVLMMVRLNYFCSAHAYSIKYKNIIYS